MENTNLNTITLTTTDNTSDEMNWEDMIDAIYDANASEFEVEYFSD